MRLAQSKDLRLYLHLHLPLHFLLHLPLFLSCHPERTLHEVKRESKDLRLYLHLHLQQNTIPRSNQPTQDLLSQSTQSFLPYSTP